MNRLARFIEDESGQDLIEYALLAALVAIVSIATIRTLGTKVAAFYTMVGTQF